MGSAKLGAALRLARLKGASRAVLLRACNGSGRTQDELGALIGTDARGVRRLQRAGRKRADRLDLLLAIDLSATGQPSNDGGSTRPEASGAPAAPRRRRAA